MRWDEVLADLDGQFDAALALELADEVGDRSRREVAALSLRQRLLGADGHLLEVMTTAGRWHGRLARVGRDWLLLGASDQRNPAEDTVVALSAVLWVTGLGRESGLDGALSQRLDLPHALRRLARDRLPVTLVLTDATSVQCYLGRVGSDFIEVTEMQRGATERGATETGQGRGPRGWLRTVPLAAVVAAHRAR